MMWLWWAIPAAYLTIAVMVQPRIASVRYKARKGSSSYYAGERTPSQASADAFGLCLIWPAMLIIMRGQQSIQSALDAEQVRIGARKQIADHSKQQAKREAEEFERALNGADGLPKHVKARNLNLDFIGAHVAGEYKWPDPETVLTINGGTA